MRGVFAIWLIVSLAATCGSARATGEPYPGWKAVSDFKRYSDLAQLAPGQCTIVVDDCETCTFGEDGKVTCSTQGIACTASHWTCMTFSPKPGN